MPPQQGTFAVSQDSIHKSRSTMNSNGLGSFVDDGSAWAGPSTSVKPRHGNEEGKKERKRKDAAAKLAREMSERERRDDYGRQYHDQISILSNIAMDLAAHPESSPAYNLRLYPVSLERSALLAQLEEEERYALECIETSYAEERSRVEDEWRRGRERIRERLLEGIDDRRRRAREEKEGEGISGDTNLDAQSRGLTRKLRNNKLGVSPPPTPLPSTSTAVSAMPPTNPHSLAVEELPSPFPLPLTAMSVPSSTGNGRKRAKGGGATVALHAGLGKAHLMLTVCKEHESESDLGDIRRGNKRRRTAVGSSTKT